MEYVFRVRTVVLIVAASALGDVFFTALQVFGVLFLIEQFGISVSEASILIPLVGVGGFVGVVAEAVASAMCSSSTGAQRPSPHRGVELPRRRDRASCPPSS